MLITAGVARALGRTMVKSLIPQVSGMNAIIRIVRRQGYGYRKEDMLSDIRRFQGRVKDEFFVRNLGPDDIIPKGFMVEAELKRDFKYRVFGDTTIYDPRSDTYKFERRSFYTDRLLTTGEWEDDFIDMSRVAYPVPEMEIAGFKLIYVEHNAGYDY